MLLASLPVKYDNILMPPAKGRDYYNGPIKIEGVPMQDSIPGMPENSKESGSITLDLSGMGAVAFKATLGGDFPLGGETQRRKTMAVRSKGKDAHFLSVLEPYESESMIKSVSAKSAHELVVELTDGRTQEITISGFDAHPQAVKVSVRESCNGQSVREEHTH